jgi:hypothetical protein
VRERSSASDREEEDEKVTEKRKRVSEKKIKVLVNSRIRYMVSYLCLFSCVYLSFLKNYLPNKSPIVRRPKHCIHHIFSK